MKKGLPDIQAVIFDLGNVLVRYDARIAARRLAREAGIPVLRVWHYFWTSPVEKAYTRGEITTRQFFIAIRRDLSLDISYRRFCEIWNDIFWPNPGIEGVLKRLATRYPLFLISNTNALHFSYIRRKFSVLNYFRKTFPSHEVGHRKPDRAIYEKVLRRIRYKPERTVFIDDVPDFVRGARRAGMHAIRYRHNLQLIRDLRRMGVKL
ncbi:MAG: HAD family hydrolase [Candidatus Omnitrophota bacterium]